MRPGLRDAEDGYQAVEAGGDVAVRSLSDLQEEASAVAECD